MNIFSLFLTILMATTAVCESVSDYQNVTQTPKYINYNIFVKKNCEIEKNEKNKKEKFLIKEIAEKMREEKIKNFNEDLYESKNSITETLLFSFCRSTFKWNQEKIIYEFVKDKMYLRVSNNLINLQDYLLFFCSNYIGILNTSNLNFKESFLKKSKTDLLSWTQKNNEVWVTMEGFSKRWKRFFLQVFCDRLKPLSRVQTTLKSEGRGRRGDHRMFAMLVMGFMIMASVLIPMGFQFLTVLGGKSLLIAKMALIISAISGLKKIATSNVGYGFYHTGSDVHHGHLHQGFHDKLYPTAPS